MNEGLRRGLGKQLRRRETHHVVGTWRPSRGPALLEVRGRAVPEELPHPARRQVIHHEYFEPSNVPIPTNLPIIRHLIGSKLLELLWFGPNDLQRQPTWPHVRNGVSYLRSMRRRVQFVRERRGTHQHRGSPAVCH